MKVPLEEAEVVKRRLINESLLDFNYKLLKEDGYIYYPVVHGILGYPTVEKTLEKKTPKNLKDALKKILTKNEILNLNTAFDTIGNIAVLEIVRSLEKKKKIIANELLKVNKNIKTVVMKKGGHEGEYRIQKYEYLFGEKNFETLHRENGVLLKLDITKTYFTPRWSSERLRIAKFVKPNEEVLVMFSGVGIFGLVIAKHTKAKEIVCVEINPDACEYAEENIKINKIKNMKNYCGDVKKVMLKFEDKKFDRIVMPLPKDSLKFLKLAFNYLKKYGIIHLYAFSTEDDIHKKIKKIESDYNCKIFNVIKTGQQSPRMWRYCLDIKT